MPRLILFILLLTVVFSWEEFKYVILALRRKNSDTDSIVSDLVLIAAIPINLVYLLSGTESSLLEKLAVICLELLVVGLFIKGVEEYAKRRYLTNNQQGFDLVVSYGFAILGLLSPTFKFAVNATNNRSRLASLFLTLTTPLVLGIGMVLVTRHIGSSGFEEKMQPLIIIAILGLVLNAVIELLEKMFKLYRLHLFSYFRVVLGIVIILILNA